MVVQVIFGLFAALPSKYYAHIVLATVGLIVLYAFTQGRTTNRERDLHARGGFTPLGLTLLTALASRGAHIIALSPYPLNHPYPSLLVPLLRSTTNNEQIFAEHADLSDPQSIRAFCTRFLTSQDTRLDALIFAHEYHGIGSLLRRWRAERYAEARDAASLATFLIITLLLPALLVEPAERDIRIVSVVNPFYAAAAPAFASRLIAAPAASSASSAIFLAEGERALRTAILTRHLQRILDSLPNQSPDEKSANEQQPGLPQTSNILTVSACPGISRKDTFAPLLGADKDAEDGLSKLGFVIYTFLFPPLFLLTKSPSSSLQTLLHVLFLPSPLRRARAALDAALNPDTTKPASGAKGKDGDRAEDMRPVVVINEEVLKPGALYRECAVVQQRIPGISVAAAADKTDNGVASRQAGKKGKSKETGSKTEFPDDGEFGGEGVGRAVWEWYEEHLKLWEAKETTARTDVASPQGSTAR